MRAEFAAAIDPCLDFLAAYLRVRDRVEEAVRPLLGLISFDSGGQSDFYARWFPGLTGLLERDGRIEQYVDGLRRLRSLLVDAADGGGPPEIEPTRVSQAAPGEVEAGGEDVEVGARKAAIEQSLSSWITPEVLSRIEAESPHAERLGFDELDREALVTLLARAFTFIETLTAAPDWFRELEAEIFHVIEQKKQQVQRVMAASQSKRPVS